MPTSCSTCWSLRGTTSEPGSTVDHGVIGVPSQTNALLSRNDGTCLGFQVRAQEGIREMQLSHDPAVVDVAFDEADLVAWAGLAPVMALAERAGLTELLAERLSVPSPNAAVKVAALLAGMVAGADSI